MSDASSRGFLKVGVVNVGVGIRQRLEAMSQPVSHSAEEEIWDIIRSWLVISRISAFIAMIAIAELMDDMMLAGLSVSLWALIIGIPLFLILSISIIWGDRWLQSVLQNEMEELVGEVDREHGRRAQLETPGRDAGHDSVHLHRIEARR